MFSKANKCKSSMNNSHESVNKIDRQATINDYKKEMAQYEMRGQGSVRAVDKVFSDDE